MTFLRDCGRTDNGKLVVCLQGRFPRLVVVNVVVKNISSLYNNCVVVKILKEIGRASCRERV